LIQNLFDRDERHRRARHHRGRQHAVPTFGLHQGNEVRIGAERLGAGLDGGGFGFAGQLDVGGAGFAVQPQRIERRILPILTKMPSTTG
jgi:hypothetical protein